MGKRIPAGDGGQPTSQADRLERLVEALYQQHHSRIFAICLARLGNPADAEDAVQETFSRLPRALQARAREEAPAWLTVVAINVCRDELRRRRTTTSGVAAEPVSDQAVDDLVLDRMVLRAVWGELSPRERLMLLNRFRGQSYEEISRAFGSSVAAAKMATSRARARARDLRQQFVATVTPLLPVRGFRLGRRLGSTLGSSPASQVPLLAVTASCLVLAALAGNGSAATARTATLTSSPSITAVGESPHPQSTAAPSSNSPAPTAPTSSPAASPPATPGPGAPKGLPIQLGPTQADAVVLENLTPSPANAVDGTVFASTGSPHYVTFPNDEVPVLFRSTDRGATWTRLPANGFLGGPILLSPRYPADPVLLALSQDGLQRSDDGGATFRLAIPTRSFTTAAVDPTSATGDTRVLLGTVPMLVYHAATGLVTPGPVLPPTVTRIDDLAFLGTSGNVIALAGGEVIRCSSAICSSSTQVDEQRITVSPAFDTDRRVALWGGSSSSTILMSSDGGATFSKFFTTASFDGNPYGIAVLLFGSQAGRVDGVYAESVWAWTSNNIPPILSRFARIRLDGTVASEATSPNGSLEMPDVVQLSNGVLIGSMSASLYTRPDGTPGYGFRCSTDRGVDWEAC